MTRNRAFALVALAVTLLLAAVLSWYASSAPDGLEKVAADNGMNAEQRDRSLGDGPLADYATRGVADDRLSGALAGAAGVGLTLAAGGGLFLLLRRTAGASGGGAGGGGGGGGGGAGNGPGDAGPVS